MNYNKKRRKRSRHPRRTKPTPRSRSLSFTSLPLSAIDRIKVRDSLQVLAHEEAEKFPTLLEEVALILQKTYPPHILAILSRYGLSSSVSSSGISDQTLIPVVQQHHVEVLQALLLMLPMDVWGTRPATPSEVQRAIGAVTNLAEAFHLRRLLNKDALTDTQRQTVALLQEQLRAHTQVVRNWGYLTTVIQVSRELYHPLDALFRERHGFSPHDLIDVACDLKRLLEGRLNEHFNALRKVLKARNVFQLVRQYYKYFPEMRGSPESFLAALPPDVSFDRVRTMLFAHSDLAIAPQACISAKELANSSALSLNVAHAVLDALSLEPGCLVDHNPEHLFLDNPVWTRPVIKMGNEYFCPTPAMIFSHIDDIVRLLADTPELKSALERRRAMYLEVRVAELLKTALPSSQQWRNIKWIDEGVEYETDLVVKLDQTIVIVECKSAALTAPGLRGAEDRVRRHVRDLILAPSKQSARLEATIWRACRGDDSALAALSSFGESFCSADLVVRISVTLDDFSVLSSSEPELKAAGWIDENVDLACTLNLADLRCAIDILPNPGPFLHYFSERQSFQREGVVVADELDFLGFYLETGFHVEGLDREKTDLVLTGMSASLDHYYNSLDAGVTLAKPRPAIDQYFEKLFAKLEARKKRGWLTLTIDLLRTFDDRSQRRVASALNELKRKVERRWRDHGHECSFWVCPPQMTDLVIVFYVYPPQLADNRHETAQQLSGDAMDATERSRCIIVARDTSQWEEPYSFIATT